MTYIPLIRYEGDETVLIICGREVRLRDLSSLPQRFKNHFIEALVLSVVGFMSLYQRISFNLELHDSNGNTAGAVDTCRYVLTGEIVIHIYPDRLITYCNPKTKVPTSKVLSGKSIGGWSESVADWLSLSGTKKLISTEITSVLIHEFGHIKHAIENPFFFERYNELKLRSRHPKINQIYRLESDSCRATCSCLGFIIRNAFFQLIAEGVADNELYTLKENSVYANPKYEDVKELLQLSLGELEVLLIGLEQTGKFSPQSNFTWYGLFEGALPYLLGRHVFLIAESEGVQVIKCTPTELIDTWYRLGCERRNIKPLVSIRTGQGLFDQRHYLTWCRKIGSMNRK